ncbi:LOW QUALITY PROTEIN: hypothetical protein Dda_0795 [Drechslerella dactyloides]|uniref:NAD-dependent epimerase/dehydratase domain-containing protein n=1 Tax=Drechslerella dactyloides TaxID=74499 RepID=A0AAD6J879_DREDA|nr:LOW QUALITY PROTEIN: hypothetical protein Dda_0795 [Drechslerella dactyloides]
MSLFSIQSPSWLTPASHSINRSRMPLICCIVSTLGCTHDIRAMPDTWSIEPRINPRLNAFISRCSTSSGATCVSFTIVANDSARSFGGRTKTASGAQPDFAAEKVRAGAQQRLFGEVDGQGFVFPNVAVVERVEERVDPLVLGALEGVEDRVQEELAEIRGDGEVVGAGLAVFRGEVVDVDAGEVEEGVLVVRCEFLAGLVGGVYMLGWRFIKQEKGGVGVVEGGVDHRFHGVELVQDLLGLVEVGAAAFKVVQLQLDLGPFNGGVDVCFWRLVLDLALQLVQKVQSLLLVYTPLLRALGPVEELKQGLRELMPQAAGPHLLERDEHDGELVVRLVAFLGQERLDVDRHGCCCFRAVSSPACKNALTTAFPPRPPLYHPRTPNEGPSESLDILPPAMSAARVLVSGSRPAFRPASAAVRNTRHIHDITITRTGKPIYRQGGGRPLRHGIRCTGISGSLHRQSIGYVSRFRRNDGDIRADGAVRGHSSHGMFGRRPIPRGDVEAAPQGHRRPGTDNFSGIDTRIKPVVFTWVANSVLQEFDLRNTQSIEESVRHSDIVINLIGRDHETKNFSFWDVHVEGTQRIVEAVAKYDVDRYIHVSSYNADLDSPSAFYRTKAQGEIEARKLFPETTIVRPSRMFGEEDRLLHMLANKHWLISSNHLREKFWPVHAIDVGKALEKIAYDDSTAGQTFELYGPKEYTMGEIRDLIKKETLQDNLTHINIPKRLHSLYRSAWEWVWWPQKCADEVEREFIDQVIDPTAKTFKDLGMTKTDDLSEAMFPYIRQYRSNKYYDLPPMTEKERQAERQYWHVQDDYIK